MNRMVRGRPASAALILAALTVVAWVEGDLDAQQPRVTFTRDVAPIVFGSCASCHRPGGSAPFPW
jgi:mono/diheme cytochrome c family protein